MGIDTSKIDFNENGEVQILDEQLLAEVVAGVGTEIDGAEELANTRCSVVNYKCNPKE